MFDLVYVVMGPFYLTLCHDFHKDVDQKLADELKKTNEAKLQVLT